MKKEKKERKRETDDVKTENILILKSFKNLKFYFI